MSWREPFALAVEPSLPSGVSAILKAWVPTLTCRDKKDARTEDDIVSAAVELAGCYTEPAEEQQRDAEDGKDAGGPDSPCGEKERRFCLWPVRPQAAHHGMGSTCGEQSENRSPCVTRDQQ